MVFCCGVFLCSLSLAHTSVMSFWVRLNFYFHLRFICKHTFFYTQMLYVNQSRVYCSTRMWVRVWVQKVAELIKRFFFLCDVLFRRVFVFILFSVCHIKIYGMLFFIVQVCFFLCRSPFLFHCLISLAQAFPHIFISHCYLFWWFKLY